MKKVVVFICLLLSVYISSAQSPTTTFTGKINGYSLSMGFKTGQLFVDNVVTGLHEVYLIDIQPDGTFSASFPLTRNRECLVGFPFFYDYVYLESGKKLIQDFDITNSSKVTSVFKGDPELASINNDINKVRPILKDYNWNAIHADIYQFTPLQYKAYFLKMQAHKFDLIDSVAKTMHMNKTSYQLARQNVKYNIAYQLMKYNSTLDDAFRLKNKLSFNSRKPELTPIRLNTAYYDFLKDMKYNDPAAMASWNYSFFMNALMNIDPIYDKAGRIDYTAQINILKTKDTTNKDVKATLAALEDMAWRNPTKPGTFEKARPVVLKKLLKTDISLELDLIYLQNVSQRMDDEKDTLSKAKFEAIRSKVKNKFLLADVAELNSKIKQNIRDAKISTGYTYNQITPNESDDNFFRNIIDKYKGKVVFVDFWATWCAPCMMSIKEIAPLKEEMAQNKDVVFLYITNTTSPEKNYQTIMPGIKGEHYRLTQDQYNLLAKQFQINGIPHYAIVNKRGGIVDRNFQWSQPEQIKKQLLALASE